MASRKSRLFLLWDGWHTKSVDPDSDHYIGATKIGSSIYSGARSIDFSGAFAKIPGAGHGPVSLPEAFGP